jgi:hypothetical protein
MWYASEKLFKKGNGFSRQLQWFQRFIYCVTIDIQQQISIFYFYKYDFCDSTSGAVHVWYDLQYLAKIVIDCIQFWYFKLCWGCEDEAHE